MPWPRLLLLSALLCGSALAQVTPPPVLPARTQPVPRLNPDELNAEIAHQAPAYGGFYLQDGLLHLVVTSTAAVARQAAVRELFAVRGEELRRQGFTPERVVFVPGQFNAAQLLEARQAVLGLPGLQTLDVDEVRNRVVAGLRFPEMQARAQAVLAAQRLPPGIVVLQVASARPLPDGPHLTRPHQARLDLPTRVRQGDTLEVALYVMNLQDQPWPLAHGACAFQLEILNAQTGEVVRPIPGGVSCEDVLRIRIVPEHGQVALAIKEWDLRRPSGELIPPGRYLVRAAFEVEDPEEGLIRPPDQTFEVVAGNPATGTAQVREVLRDGASGIQFQTRLGEERGQQVVSVFVPDRRAQAGVERLLRERKLPLDRVRFRILPPTRVPGQGQGPARLRVENYPGGRQHGFELTADLTPWLARGAWRCEPVVNVVDQRSGEVVGDWPGFRIGAAQRACAEDGQPLPYSRGGGWEGRRSDGTPLSTGTYEVRAGLKVTLKTGRVVWLLAPVQELTVP